MPRLKLGNTLWDQTLGRALYDQNVRYRDIARALGGTVRDNHISSFARRHWPPRDEEAVRRLHLEHHPKPPRKPRTAARKMQKGESSLPVLGSLADAAES